MTLKPITTLVTEKRKQLSGTKNLLSTSSENSTERKNALTNYRSNELLAQFPESTTLLAAYNPDKILTVMKIQDPVRIYRGSAPELRTLRDTYSEDVAETWIEIMLERLSEFAGVKDKMDQQHLSILSAIILSEYSYLKMSEFMYFIGRVMAGKYGCFYGIVDPMDIATFLTRFVRERNAEVSRLEDEEIVRRNREEKARWRDEAMSYEEWKTLSPPLTL